MKVSRGPWLIVAKLGLGGLVVVYVLRSHMIDFRGVGEALRNPLSVLAAVVFLALDVLCAAARWRVLLGVQDIRVSFIEVVRLSLVGNFCNTFLPGAVGGDVVKAYIVPKGKDGQMVRTAVSIILDRILGLAAMAAAAALTLSSGLVPIGAHQESRLLSFALWGGLAVLALAVLVTAKLHRWRWLRETTERRGLRTTADIVRALEVYRHHPRLILLACGLSGIAVVAMNVSYFIQGTIMGIPLHLSSYFLIVPVGVIVSAIPLLPGGLGTGQLAFFTLFLWTGAARPQQGGALFTLLQLYGVLFNAIGIVFYLKRRSPSTSGAPSDAAAPTLIETTPLLGKPAHHG